MLTTMSWAVTAWPPVGGLGGLRANSFTICTVKSSRHGHTHTDRDSYTHTHITHRDPRTASTYSDAHTDRDSYTHGHRYTQRPTHYLNSLDLTLHTAHLTDNSHSDFLRDEKCFRATRRLVLNLFKAPKNFKNLKYLNRNECLSLVNTACLAISYTVMI